WKPRRPRGKPLRPQKLKVRTLMTPIGDSLAREPAVERVLRQGYHIEHEFAAGTPFLEVGGSRDGRSVAYARFECDETRHQLIVDNVNVLPEHKRRGIANAMTICALRLTGYTKLQAGNKTDEGSAWLDQPNRPW